MTRRDKRPGLVKTCKRKLVKSENQPDDIMKLSGLHLLASRISRSKPDLTSSRRHVCDYIRKNASLKWPPRASRKLSHLGTKPARTIENSATSSASSPEENRSPRGTPKLGQNPSTTTSIETSATSSTLSPEEGHLDRIIAALNAGSFRHQDRILNDTYAGYFQESPKQQVESNASKDTRRACRSTSPEEKSVAAFRRSKTSATSSTSSPEEGRSPPSPKPTATWGGL